MRSKIIIATCPLWRTWQGGRAWWRKESWREGQLASVLWPLDTPEQPQMIKRIGLIVKSHYLAKRWENSRLNFRSSTPEKSDPLLQLPRPQQQLHCSWKFETLLHWLWPRIILLLQVEGWGSYIYLCKHAQSTKDNKSGKNRSEGIPKSNQPGIPGSKLSQLLLHQAETPVAVVGEWVVWGKKQLTAHPNSKAVEDLERYTKYRQSVKFLDFSAATFWQNLPSEDVAQIKEN